MENNFQNKGVAFKNKWKKTDRHPDFKGKGNFNGVDFEFAAWKKNGADDQINFTFSQPYMKEETVKDYNQKSELNEFRDNFSKKEDPSDALPF